MSLATIKIEKIFHNTHKKDGTPYQNSKGAFTQCIVYSKDKEGNEQKLSGYGDDVTKTWQVGQTVEVDIDRNGEYLNFRPSQGQRDRTKTVWQEIAELKERLARLERSTDQQVAQQFGGEVVQPNMSTPVNPDDQGIEIDKIPF